MEAASVRDRLREAQLSNELADQVQAKKKRLTKCPHGTWLVYDYYYDVYMKKKKCPHIVDMVGIFPNPEYSPYDPCLLVRKHTAFCRETLRPYVKTVMRQVFQVRQIIIVLLSRKLIGSDPFFQALAWCHKHKIAHCNVDTSSITWEWNETRTEPHIYLTNFEEAENARDFKYEVREIDLRASCILFLELVCLILPRIWSSYKSVANKNILVAGS